MCFCKFYQSTIGKKVVVALTGLMLYGFVVGHMLGNLKAFAGYGSDGVHKLDHYAHFLREMGSHLFGYSNLLWAMRGGLILAAVLHIVTVIQLTIRNRQARPIAYQSKRNFVSALPARMMQISGMVVLLFIITHLLHLTFGKILIPNFVAGAVYANIYSSFSKAPILAIYVFCMFLLSMHLYHGIWSLFHTLGLNSPSRNGLFKGLAVASAVFIFLGFVSVPCSIFLGKMPEPKTTIVEVVNN